VEEREAGGQCGSEGCVEGAVEGGAEGAGVHVVPLRVDEMKWMEEGLDIDSEFVCVPDIQDYYHEALSKHVDVYGKWSCAPL
jgi:hypothetical protein